MGNDTLAIDSEANAKEQKKLQKQERNQELDDIRELLKHAWGRRIVWRLLTKAEIYTNAMTGNAWTHFKLGMQNFGQWLLAEVLDADPESYTKLLIENRSKSND